MGLCIPLALPGHPRLRLRGADHHGVGSGFITGTGGTGSAASAGSGAHADNTVATATGITLGTNTAGGGQAFNPPWLGVIYLIKL